MKGKYNPWLVIATILLQTLLIAIINIELCTYPDTSKLKAFVTFINFIIMGLSVLVIVSIKQILKNHKKQVEDSYLRQHLHEVEDMIIVLNSERHEYVRHIQILQSMLYLQEMKAAEDYIDGIARDYLPMQEIILVKDPALKSLLISKQKVAESFKVDFAFAIKCDLTCIGVEKWDLCSIIGNLLDNAFDASIQGPLPPRVTMEIKHEENKYVIYVHNSGMHVPEWQKKKLFEPRYTNKDSENHGYGLYVVKQLVDKYNGEIKMISQDKISFIVYLPEKGAGKNDTERGGLPGEVHGKAVTGYR